MNPGLSLDDLMGTLQNDLKVDVPPQEMARYFDIMDANHDGHLQADEFIPTLRIILTKFVPLAVMTKMNLLSTKIVLAVLAALFQLCAIFALITLVIQAFTTGGGVASAVHSITSAGAVLS